MVFFYNLGIRLYVIAIRIAALFIPKAKLWTVGRRRVFEHLENAVKGSKELIWMHCASLGEFEQGRPLLEKIKLDYPQKKILLTFFSPSGYEIRKSYAGVDWVFYLPADTKKNAQLFTDIVNPSLAIFVKYEYWYHYLSILNNRGIPTILISAIFRDNSIFFKWYGGFYRKMLTYFTHIFVQNAASLEKVSNLCLIKNISLAGDTRFDRVINVANNFKPIPEIESFIAGRPVIIAGSTWQADEQHLLQLLEKLKHKLLLIVAPHEVTHSHIQFLNSLFENAVLFSNLAESRSRVCKVLIIDNIGMLSKLYHYSTISYVGGGFNSSGIHNTLEAAVYEKPVIFGPNYEKFDEAKLLIKNGGAFSYKNDNQLFEKIETLLNNPKELYTSGKIAGKFVRDNEGATQKIIAWIRQNVF